MKYTKNYNFKKPEPHDTRNINDINESFDLVDAKLKETQDKNVNLDETFKQLVIDKGNNNAEIVAARRDKFNNKTYNSVPDRLDDFSGKLAQKATLSQLSQVASPLVASISTSMTNTTRVYVYTGTENGYVPGNWYYYNGLSWISGGTYQSTGLADKSVFPTQTTFCKNNYDSNSDVVDVKNSSTIIKSTRINGATGEAITSSSESVIIYSTINDFVNVDKYYKLYVGYNKNNYSMPYVFFYNSDYDFLGQAEITNPTTESFDLFNEYYGRYVTVPENAKYVKFSYVTSRFQGYAIYIIKPRISIPDLVIAKSQISDLLDYDDVTIVNFGDSIFGNNDTEMSVSNQISQNLRSNVINCGFGGTRIATRKTSGGIQAFDFSTLVDSIISEDYSYQDANVSSIEVAYYTARLNRLKSINFANVDIVTFNFGTNDWTGGTQMENSNDLYDKTYYKGALRYCIEKILTAYQHIKIILITPTWRFWYDSDGSFYYDSNTATMGGGQNLPVFVNAMKSISNEYQLPIIDAYYLLGANKFNYSNFFPSNDGTHHSENGRKELGRLISQQIKAIL